MISVKRWIPALAAIPALVLLSACEPRDDEPMVTEPDQEQETEFGQRDREVDPAQDPAQEPSQEPAQDPAMDQPEEQQQQEQDAPY